MTVERVRLDDFNTVPSRGERPPDPPTAGEAEALDALDLAAFLAKPPSEPDWDWRGFHARGDVVLEVGDPGAGKSMNALARAVAHATGGGHHLGEPLAARRVLFVDLENPDDVVYQRLWSFGVRGVVDGLAYVHRPAGFNLLDSECFARLRETIILHAAELVFIDSLRRGAPGLDENDSRDVSIVFSGLRELAKGLGCGFVVVHHPRKPVGDVKVEALYAARGSGDLTGSVDSYLFYRRLAGGLVRLEHGKARRGREHEPVQYRIVADAAGQPVIEHVSVEPKASDEELDARVLAWLVAHPPTPESPHGIATKHVENGVGGNRERVRESLQRLETGRATTSVSPGDPGRPRRPVYWKAANHADLTVAPLFGATPGDPSPAVSQGQVSPESPAALRAGDTRGDTLDDSPTGPDFADTERITHELQKERGSSAPVPIADVIQRWHDEHEADRIHDQYADPAVGQ